MTVGVDVIKIRAVGNDVTTAWPYTFTSTADTDVAVYVKIGTAAQALIDPADYTLVRDDALGGTVTYPLVGSPLTSADVITIIRETPYTNTFDFSPQARVTPTQLENSDDNLVRGIQQLDERLQRAVLVEETSSVDPADLLATLSQDAVDAAASAAAAATSETNAGTSETNAAASEAAAAASAAGVNLPSITASDTGKLLVVNAVGTAHELLSNGTSGQVLTSTGASSAPTWQDTGAVGKLLQTVSTTVSTNTTSTSGTYADATGVTVSITPSATSSKVLVRIAGCGLIDGAIGTSAGIQIVRDSTSITEQSNLIKSHTASYDGWGFCIEFYDSPSTTSATTYKLQFKRAGGTGTIWINGGATYDTTITAMEIGA